MTAEPDLLPLRDWMECLGEANAEDIRDYARANVAHAVAPLQAEIEALRAEVERLTFEMGRLRQQYDERTACMIVHRGAALACSDAVRAAYSEEHERAERLAEALRDAADDIDAGVPPEDAAAHLRARADLLRDQEEGHEK